MTEEFLKALAVVPESVDVVTLVCGKDFIPEIARVKEEALKPAVCALVIVMEKKGYKISELLETLESCLSETYRNRAEVGQWLKDAAAFLKKIEEQGSDISDTLALAKAEDLKNTVCALLRTLEHRAYQIMNLMESLANCVYEACPHRKTEVNYLDEAMCKLRHIEERYFVQIEKGDTTPVSGKLEIAIKINSLPNVQTVENGWQHFNLECDGQIVSVTVKPRVWRKLLDAQANYPQWFAAIAGKMGDRTEKGFVLDEPNIQVFERNPKDPKVEAEAVATGS